MILLKKRLKNLKFQRIGFVFLFHYRRNSKVSELIGQFLYLI